MTAFKITIILLTVKIICSAAVYVGFLTTTTLDASTYAAVILERILLFLGVYIAISGIIAAVFTTGRHIYSRFLNDTVTVREVYDLAHVMLNLDSEPLSTWNNMGYWSPPVGSSTVTDFKLAAKSLAIKLSDAARLNVADTMIDVGIGCGDQSVLYSRLVGRYIGITSLQAHSDLAYAALKKRGLLGNAHILALDASDPLTTWPTEILNTTVVEGRVNKILALDCLYHFQPSRKNFFKFVNGALECAFEKRLKNGDDRGEVCFAAEDLLAGRELNLSQWLRLRVICALARTPFRNFISIEEYMRLLEDSGFTRERGWTVQFEDISDHVFPGLTNFIEMRGSGRDGIGKYLKFERFKMFGKVVRWWQDDGVVKAYIVTLRKKTECK
ncbi:uncharacterized protein V1513DRAFT_446970 [Lipomyces chichibuensis]|uniref:uncharacterized protein n=1 Tax=Lipomyces chichibuensis TaxID=1546026 RepID=UPI0033434901